ncbi:MAG: flagellar basal body P-ring formation protein FlgA [Methylococcaceae bacterium]|nr:MAG: flagellar basal body P-ring formation protein FlgA [Methylococcaceae bacterium]
MRRLPPFLFLCLFTSIVRCETSQPHETILVTARGYLETQVVPPGSDYQIDISPIESRLQLPHCDAPLQAFNLNEAVRSGQLTIGVRCPGSTPWVTYIRAKVSLYQIVLVLNDTLPQGSAISPAHLDFAKKDVAELRYGYFTAPEQVVGKTIKRTLPAGTVLTGNVLEMLKIIKRGDKVTIHLRNELLDVHMDGTAMTDAEPGQRVRVRNENSQRIVEGTAVAPGTVEVE